METGNTVYHVKISFGALSSCVLYSLSVLACVAFLQTIAVRVTTVNNNSFSFRALLQHHLAGHNAR